MHTVFALLCFNVVIHWLIFPYPSGLLHWHCGNLTIAPVPAKQPWWIWINTSCEFIMNDCITTTKQSTTKPCAYFLGYTVTGTRAVNTLQGLQCTFYLARTNINGSTLIWFMVWCMFDTTYCAIKLLVIVDMSLPATDIKYLIVKMTWLRIELYTLIDRHDHIECQCQDSTCMMEGCRVMEPFWSASLHRWLYQLTSKSACRKQYRSQDTMGQVTQ